MISVLLSIVPTAEPVILFVDGESKLIVSVCWFWLSLIKILSSDEDSSWATTIELAEDELLLEWWCELLELEEEQDWVSEGFPVKTPQLFISLHVLDCCLFEHVDQSVQDQEGLQGIYSLKNEVWLNGEKSTKPSPLLIFVSISVIFIMPHQLFSAFIFPEREL